MSKFDDTWALLKPALGAFAHLMEAYQKSQAGEPYGVSVARGASELADLVGKLRTTIPASPPSSQSLALPRSSVVNLTGKWDFNGKTVSTFHNVDTGFFWLLFPRNNASGYNSFSGAANSDSRSARYLISGTNSLNQLMVSRGISDGRSISETTWNHTTGGFEEIVARRL